MTSGITEYEAKIIDLRDGIVRAAMSGQYQDADDMLTAFADEIRAEAAEKAVAAFNEWALNRIIIDKYKLVEGCTMIDSAITGKEPKK